MKKRLSIMFVAFLFILPGFSYAENTLLSESPFSIFPEITWNMTLEQILEQDSYYAVSNADSAYPNIRQPFLLDGAMAYVSYTFEKDNLFIAYLAWYPNQLATTDYKAIYEEAKQKVRRSSNGFVMSDRSDWDNNDVGWSWLGNGQMVSVNVVFGGEFGIGYSVSKTRPAK